MCIHIDLSLILSVEILMCDLGFNDSLLLQVEIVHVKSGKSLAKLQDVSTCTWIFRMMISFLVYFYVIIEVNNEIPYHIF